MPVWNVGLFGQSRDIKYSQLPTWVKEYPLNPDFRPDERKIGSGYYAVQIIYQCHLPSNTEFREIAYRPFNATGISEISDVSITYNPEYQQLNLHYLYVLRAGIRIDKRTGNKVQFHYVEEQAAQRIYDGRVTATIHLEDIRQGDILVYAYSLIGDNPVFAGRFSRHFYLCTTDSIDRLVVRHIEDPDQPLHFKLNSTVEQPVISNDIYGRSLEWELRNLSGVDRWSYPDWHMPYPMVFLSEFGSWKEVNDWAEALFASGTISPELQAWIRQLERRFDSLEDRILHAIRWVQSEVRYLGLEIGENSHRPAPASETFRRRYGDCKDKSLLLVKMLNELGIESNVLLVSTWLLHAVGEVLPSPYAFDHCVVEFHFKGSTLYIDPTNSFQGGPLTELYFPWYGHGLPIIPGNTNLRELPEPKMSEVSMIETFYVDSIGGGGRLNVLTTYNGGSADYKRAQFEISALSEVEETYLNYYKGLYEHVRLEAPVTIVDDTLKNEFSIREAYVIDNLWIADSTDTPSLELMTKGSLILDYLPDEPELDYDGPYEMYHPYLIKHSVALHMPEEWNNNLDPEFYTSAAANYRKTSELVRDSLFIVYHTLETKARHIRSDSLQELRDFLSNVEESIQVSLTYRDLSPGTWQAYVFTLAAVMLGLLIGGLVSYRVYHYDPPPKVSVPGVSGIGGWLILPMIGLLSAPFRIVVELFNQDFFAFESWNILLHPESLKMYPGLIPLIFVEFTANVLLLVFTILLIVLFFGKRSSVPTLMIAWYVGFSVLFFGDLLAYELLNLNLEETESPGDMRGIARSLVALMIWVPYFLYSERVRNTFVNRLDRNSQVYPVVGQSGIDVPA